MTLDEGNRIIAEFDGWFYSKSGKTVRKNTYTSPYRLKDIRYNVSYDWLMPVAKKILKCHRYGATLWRILTKWNE